MSDDRLNTVIKEGKQGEIVLIGVSVDEARKSSCNKGGQDNGPCCLRRFYYKVGPVFNSEYEADISKLKISDFGNLYLENQPQRPILFRIGDLVTDLLQNNQVPIVIGGSKEAMVGSIYGFEKAQPKGQIMIICGQTHSKAYKENKLLSSNALTKIIHDLPETKIVLFGAHSRQLPMSKGNNYSCISIQDIRRQKILKKQLGISTQGGNSFRKLSSNQKKQVNLTLEGIERFQGCRDNVSQGLTVEQILQIFYYCGLSSSVLSLSISQFNPSCEDFQSSLLILNLIYYYLMGRSKR